MDWCGVNYVRTQHKEEWDGLGSLWKPPKTNWPIRPCNQQDIYRSIKFYTVFRRLGSFYPFFNSFMVPMSDEKIGHKINHVPPPWTLLSRDWWWHCCSPFSERQRIYNTLKVRRTAAKRLLPPTQRVNSLSTHFWREHQLGLKHTAATSETSDKHHLFFFCSLSGLFVTTLENLKYWSESYLRDLKSKYDEPVLRARKESAN